MLKYTVNCQIRYCILTKHPSFQKGILSSGYTYNDELIWKWCFQIFYIKYLKFTFLHLWHSRETSTKPYNKKTWFFKKLLNIHRLVPYLSVIYSMFCELRNIGIAQWAHHVSHYMIAYISHLLDYIILFSASNNLSQK